MLTIRYAKTFKKDFKLLVKRGYNIELLEEVINILSQGKQLPAKFKEHNLKGDYIGYKECHITPDWLLIYKIVSNELVLFLTRTGTHSDLF